MKKAIKILTLAMAMVLICVGFCGCKKPAILGGEKNEKYTVLEHPLPFQQSDKITLKFEKQFENDFILRTMPIEKGLFAIVINTNVDLDREQTTEMFRIEFYEKSKGNSDGKQIKNDTFDVFFVQSVDENKLTNETLKEFIKTENDIYKSIVINISEKTKVAFASNSTGEDYVEIMVE